MTDDFVHVAEVSDVPPGTTKIVKVGDAELFVANVGGSFYALSNKCTHLGGPLGRGKLTGNIIQCPWHGSKFDVTTGAVVRGPSQKPEPTFEVKVEGTSLWVKKPA